MKKYLNLMLMALICVIMCSCRSSKEAALSDLRDFSTELQANANNYDKKDWSKAIDKYQKINKKLKEHATDYNSEEMEEIGTLQGQCMSSFASVVKDKATGLTGMLKGLIQGLSGITGGLNLDNIKDIDLDTLKGLLLGK